MAGFMNAELESIRDNLQCGHCEAIFKGSDSQARKVKYEGRIVYCSAACRAAAMSQRGREQAVREGKKPRKGVLSGPCKKCGKLFESRIDKMYCSMDCYTTSDQFRKMQSEYWAPSESARARIAAKLRTGGAVPCLECGDEFYRKKSDSARRKFCTKVCYRSYMAKRFDRWVANPESMSLPQCYDEFLDRERLRCVVDGCDWEGLHLTVHMNLAHGQPARDFKRAAGFNIGTGVIARPLAEAFQSRGLVGVAINRPRDALEHSVNERGNYIRYVSMESREHQKKARAMMGIGPTRLCRGCGREFVQSTPMGRALYCSVECRSRDYAEKARTKRRLAKQLGFSHMADR